MAETGTTTTRATRASEFAARAEFRVEDLVRQGKATVTQGPGFTAARIPLPEPQGPGLVKTTIGWSAVHADSSLSVGVSEASAAVPHEPFLGDAVFQVMDYAPEEGGFTVRFNVGWGSALYTCLQVTTFDHAGV
jgi:hypothetical protein